jgi:hypothetical protein
LLEHTGSDTIPVLRTSRGHTITGEEAILAHLDQELISVEAHAHRLRAEKARRRYLEEECGCPPQPLTRRALERASQSLLASQSTAPLLVQ